MVNTHPIWGKFPKIQAFLTECLELIIEKITIENKEIEQTVIDLIERQGKLLRPAYFFLFSQFGSAGPLPIASTPFGEFFIGLSYGFSIFASMVYVNAFDVISFDWIMGRNNQMLTAQLGPVLCLDCPAVLGYLEGPRLIVDTSAVFFDLI